MPGKLTDREVQQVRLDRMKQHLFLRIWHDRAAYLRWVEVSEPCDIIERALSTPEELSRFAAIFLIGMNSVLTILRGQAQSLEEVEGLEPEDRKTGGPEDRKTGEEEAATHARQEAELDECERRLREAQEEEL